MSVTEKSPKYQALIKEARKLFWKHGLKRVTVEEICRSAGVSKMTFYKYFPNKLELARSVYDNVVDNSYNVFKEIIEDPSTTPEEKIEGILRLKMEGSHDISREFLSDFYGNHELGLSDHVEEKTRQIWKNVIADLSRAQQKGWIRRDFNPGGMFIFMTKLSELLNDESLQQIYSSPQQMIMELTKFFTYGILPSEHR